LRFVVDLFLTGDAIERRFDFKVGAGFFVAGAFFFGTDFFSGPASTTSVIGGSDVRLLFLVAAALFGGMIKLKSRLRQ
jgi:hypothetical protein